MRGDLADRLRQLAFRFPVEERRTLDEFLPAPCNEAALALVLAWPAWPAHVAVVSGPEGSGKSHLLRIFQQIADAPLWSGPELARDRPPWERIGPQGAVAVDDADRTRDPEALLQLVNAVRERDGRLLLAGRTPAARWELGPPDLRSRLRAAHHVAIDPPDLALLEALLVKRARDRGLDLPPAVVRYLVARAERSFAAPGRLVEALDELSLASGRKVGMEIARLALERAGAGATGEAER
ncbi:DnaA regulatory inactivator Hda [bacterium HR39]|nr:DnaA regulatory inactivator Hda [bacterium HR39]